MSNPTHAESLENIRRAALQSSGVAQWPQEWAIGAQQLAELSGMRSTLTNVEEANQARKAAGYDYSEASGLMATNANGVAVLKVQGMIAHKPHPLLQLLGACSAGATTAAIRHLANDPNVKSVVLYIDSPGGTVLGTTETAEALYSLSRSKPVVAWSDGMLCSAAYWIASAAGAVFLSGPAVMVGSIGVVLRHEYRPPEGGQVITDVYAGKFKTVGSSSAPLSAEHCAVLQERCDYLYSLFVADVARNRSKPVSTVKDSMADGRVFIGQQAVSAGLVDGLRTWSAMMSDLVANPSRYLRRAGQSAAAGAAGTAQASAQRQPAALLAAPRPSTPQTPAEWASAAKAEAERSRIDFVAALKKLGYPG